MKTLFVGMVCALFTAPSLTSAEILRLECLGTVVRSEGAVDSEFPVPRSRKSDDDYWESLWVTEPFGYRFAIDLDAGKGQHQRMCIEELDGPDYCRTGSWTKGWHDIDSILNVMPNTISSNLDEPRESKFGWEIGGGYKGRLSINRLTGSIYYEYLVEYRFHVNYDCINANQFDHFQCDFSSRDYDFKPASRYPEQSWEKIKKYAGVKSFRGICEKMTDKPKF